MDEQQSQEIAQEIETKRQQLRQTTQTLSSSSSSNLQHPLLQEKFPPIFEKEQELTRLYEEYERLTGEPYDDDSDEDESAAVIHFSQQQDDKEKSKRLS
jgi:cell shape-determining protein MreC